MRDRQRYAAPDEMKISVGEFLALDKVVSASIDVLIVLDEISLERVPEARGVVQKLEARVNQYRKAIGLEPRTVYGWEESPQERKKRRRKQERNRARAEGQVRKI